MWAHTVPISSLTSSQKPSHTRSADGLSLGDTHAIMHTEADLCKHAKGMQIYSRQAT